MTRRLIVTRADGLPANATRRTGYVTQSLIDKHGDKLRALAALNAHGGDMVKAGRVG